MGGWQIIMMIINIYIIVFEEDWNYAEKKKVYQNQRKNQAIYEQVSLI